MARVVNASDDLLAFEETNEVPITAMGPSEVPMFTFIVEGVLLTVISIIGIFGNIFSVMGLAKNKKSTRSFTKLLIALAICDLIYLVISLIIFGFPTLSEEFKKNIYVFVLPVCYGLAHVSRVGSISLTLSVTIERYYSVCHPLSQFQIKRHLLTISLLFAIVYNIPRFFELSLRGDKPGEYEIVTTDLRRNPYYALLYIFWAKFLLVEMLPYVIMIGLNILIFRRVKQLVKMRSEVGIEPASGAVHQDEIDLAVILLAIVCIFIFCQSFKIIPDIYEVCTCTSTHIRTRACKGTWTIEYIIDMSHCFLALNSSINFFIYIIKGGKFREAILKRFLTIGPRTDVQTRSATNYEMVVNQAPSPPKAHQNVSKADNSDSKDLLEMKPIQDRTIKEESIQNGQDQPDEDVDRNLRWPFLMYDMPTILVEDDEHHKSPRISIYSRKSSSNSHNWFFKRALSSTSKSDTSYNSKSESNSHANDESSNGVSGGSAPFVGNTSSTNLTVTDTGKVSKPSTHIQGGTNQDKDPKMTQNKIVNAHSLVV